MLYGGLERSIKFWRVEALKDFSHINRFNPCSNWPSLLTNCEGFISSFISLNMLELVNCSLNLLLLLD